VNYFLLADRTTVTAVSFIQFCSTDVCSRDCIAEEGSGFQLHEEFDRGPEYRGTTCTGGPPLS
jgi:hypothetical protein